jgi:hypothetical protein
VPVARRSIVWLVTVPLAVASSQAAHALAYRIGGPDARTRAHELAESGHAYLAYMPLAIAAASALVVLALVSELRAAAARPGRGGARPPLWSFAALAPLLFTCQEHFERLAHDGAFPWSAILEPTFAIGLALQLPLAVAAYLAAGLLLRGARSLGRLLAAPPPAPAGAAVRWTAVAAAPLRPRSVSLGYGSRGPPLSFAA